MRPVFENGWFLQIGAKNYASQTKLPKIMYAFGQPHYCRSTYRVNNCKERKYLLRCDPQKLSRSIEQGTIRSCCAKNPCSKPVTFFCVGFRIQATSITLATTLIFHFKFHICQVYNVGRGSFTSRSTCTLFWANNKFDEEWWSRGVVKLRGLLIAILRQRCS